MDEGGWLLADYRSWEQEAMTIFRKFANFPDFSEIDWNRNHDRNSSMGMRDAFIRCGGKSPASE
jgi:hypothetical protein